MISLCAFALCVSANVRAYGEHTAARIALAQEQNAMAEVGTASAQMADEVRRLKADPQTIETAARANLRMLRRNEIIVSAQALPLLFPPKLITPSGSEPVVRSLFVSATHFLKKTAALASNRKRGGSDLNPRSSNMQNAPAAKRAKRTSAACL